MIRIEGGLDGLLMECGKKDVHEQIAFVKFASERLNARKAPAPVAPATPAAAK